ncbi:MAG: hypothetical protein IKB27_05065 [Clostridia bacterium]|nr:hypothetical protein [Clostridia bacterium]
MSTFISKPTSSEAHELIKNFFDGDETLIKTFDIVSEHMLGLDDQVILRGSEHVIGISKENERYRFYVNKRERYSIKYKNWDKPEDFDPQNVEKYFSENIKCNEYFSKNPSECTIKKVSTKNKTNTNGRQSREEVLLELWKPIKEKVKVSIETEQKIDLDYSHVIYLKIIDLLEKACDDKEIITSRSKDVIKNRILCSLKLTLQQLGENHDLSRERIRQIETKSWKKLSMGIYCSKKECFVLYREQLKNLILSIPSNVLITTLAIIRLKNQLIGDWLIMISNPINLDDFSEIVKREESGIPKNKSVQNLDFKHSKLKDLIDIVEYVSENQKITKSGKNYNTKCPICGNEKTLVIFPETKSFYCFSCANGGDIITYVMKSKNVGYLDAIDILSNYAKIDFQKEERYSKSKLMREAALYYHSQLRENKFAKTAVNILHSWGISGKTIVQLGIGYHDKSPDCFKKHMVKKKSYTMEQLEDVFLVMKSQNGTYCDKMRDSIIIPTINSDSEVVGFDFYVIGQERLYRYPNTETFQRGENLYSYNLALKSNKKSVILVTNYEDYFYLVGKGINNVVSTYLPKITKEQFSLLKNKFKVIMILTNQNFNIAECRIFCNKNNVYCDAFDIPNEVSVKEYIDIHENEIKEKIETYDSL